MHFILFSSVINTFENKFYSEEFDGNWLIFHQLCYIQILQKGYREVIETPGVKRENADHLRAENLAITPLRLA